MYDLGVAGAVPDAGWILARLIRFRNTRKKVDEHTFGHRIRRFRFIEDEEDPETMVLGRVGGGGVYGVGIRLDERMGDGCVQAPMIAVDAQHLH